MSLLDKTNLLITPNAVKAGVLYSVIPSNGNGDCTVVRNTTATRVNSSGLIESVAANTPRLNYSTVGGTPFILDEPQRTNVSTFSEDLSNVSFLKSGMTVFADSFISPSGISNADKIIPSAVNSFHNIGKTNTVTNGSVNTFSVFAKKNGYDFLLINTPTGSSSGNSGPIINLSNGTVVGVFGSTNYNVKVLSYPNNWYRIDMAVTSNGTSLKIDLNVFPTSSVSSYAGNENSGILIWGYSLEVGSSVSSYIPTTNAAVTRNADVITVAPLAGTVKITTTFSDNTTQVITSIPALFTVPEGLIKQVLMQSSL